MATLKKSDFEQKYANRGDLHQFIIIIISDRDPLVEFQFLPSRRGCLESGSPQEAFETFCVEMSNLSIRNKNNGEHEQLVRENNTTVMILEWSGEEN